MDRPFVNGTDIGCDRYIHASPSLIFEIADGDAFLLEAVPLFKEHHEEIAAHRDVQILEPDYEWYYARQAEGNLLIVTATFGGHIVGYFIWLFTESPHYKGVKYAVEDVHFLQKQYRVGMNGYLLMRYAVDFARRSGAKILQAREKAEHSHEALFKRLGFKVTDIVYTMSCGD